MVRALPHGSDSRIDFGRVAAIAAAIAVHAAALLMLLMPMAAPPIAAVAKPKMTMQWYPKEQPKQPVEVKVVKPATPKPVEPRPVIQPRTVTETPVIDTPVIIDGGNQPVIDNAVAGSGDIAGPSIGNGPLPSATLEYVRASSPRYPIAELKRGIEGTVVLRVLVDTDGTPIDVSIENSSGSRNLDKEARQHVLKSWRFKPAMQNGQAVQAYGLVPIAFSLQ